MIKRETYLQKIRPFINTDLIKVMTGMRRCGKSVMLELIKQELLASGVSRQQIISLNFEDMRYTHLNNAQALHDEVIKLATAIEGKVFLFFDEVQEVEHWERCLNSFRLELNCDIYITGSSAKLLSGELATVLGGRYVEFNIYPFSFTEFKELYCTVCNPNSEQEIFRRYLTLGGMPYLANLNYSEEPSRQYLQDVFNSVVLNDIIKRNKVRDVDLLTRIILYIMQNIGNTFSAASITKFLKNERRHTSTETILNYISYAINAYFLYKIRREDLVGKQILSTNEKYYLADHGLREAICGGNTSDINLILENIVFLELLRRGYKVTVGKVGHKEIDFVAQKREHKIYIQVTYLLASEETITREFDVYNLIDDNFPKYVVSLDELNFSRRGIKHYHIREFLALGSWD